MVGWRLQLAGKGRKITEPMLTKKAFSLYSLKNKRMKAENIGTILGVITLVFIIGFAIWVSFFAPCKKISWLPIANLPARCLIK